MLPSLTPSFGFWKCLDLGSETVRGCEGLVPKRLLCVAGGPGPTSSWRLRWPHFPMVHSHRAPCGHSWSRSLMVAVTQSLSASLPSHPGLRVVTCGHSGGSTHGAPPHPPPPAADSWRGGHMCICTRRGSHKPSPDRGRKAAMRALCQAAPRPCLSAGSGIVFILGDTTGVP